MTCDELRGNYELYSLGLLEEPELAEVREHLGRNCPNCAAELKRALELNVLMLCSAPDAQPSSKLRARILSSVGAKQSSPWAAILGWGMAAAAAAISCMLFFMLKDTQVAERASASKAAEMRSVLALLTEPDTKQVTFGKGPQGRVLINAKQGVLFIASNLPRTEAGKTYEFWIIPKGGAPRPAGLFQSDANGNALHRVEGPVDVSGTGAFAVSVEPESGSPAPTTTPLIVAPLTSE